MELAISLLCIAIFFFVAACIMWHKDDAKRIAALESNIKKLTIRADELRLDIGYVEHEIENADAYAKKVEGKIDVHTAAINNLKNANKEILDKLSKCKSRDEKKEDCIAYMIEFGNTKSMREGAAELDIPYSTFKRWWSEYKKENEL